MSKNARWVLIGALLNAEAVAKAAFKIARNEGVGISIVLSGKNRCFFIEDFICAGTIVEALQIDNVECSDAALAALSCFRQARGSLGGVILSGHHAIYLKSLGFVDDVEFCSQLNVFRIVPYLRGGVIVPLCGLVET